MVGRGEELVYVMSVEHHKTSLEGFAKVVMQLVDHARVLQYTTAVRPLQVADSEAKYLFLLSGGRCVVNLCSKIKCVGEKSSLRKARKIGATSVAMELGSSANAHLVTRQIAHSATTEARYYQATAGDKHAASAFSTMMNLMSGLGKGSETECSPKLSVTRLSAGERVATSGSEGWSSPYKQEVTSESQTSEP